MSNSHSWWGRYSCLPLEAWQAGMPAPPVSLLPAEAELVAGGDGHAVLEVDLDHLLAVNFSALLVGQRGDDLLGRGVDHLAGGRVGVLAVEAEGHPAGLFAEFHARDVLWRHCGRVEHVDALVERIHHPQFLLVGREADAVARAAVP